MDEKKWPTWQSCKKCAIILSTKSEINTGLCLSCLPNELDRLYEVEASVKDTNVLIQDLSAKLNNFETARLLREKLKYAEDSGYNAAQREASFEDNPFEKDSNDAAMWNYGWLNGSKDKMISSMERAMLWTIDVMDIISQIGGSEVLAKVKTINETLSVFLTKWKK